MTRFGDVKPLSFYDMADAITERGERIEDLDCLDGPHGCEGAVEYRTPLSGTGRSFPRCERHWDQRLAKQDEINQRYGSPAPPSDFDPAYAGERWEEE